MAVIPCCCCCKPTCLENPLRGIARWRYIAIIISENSILNSTLSVSQPLSKLDRAETAGPRRRRRRRRRVARHHRLWGVRIDSHKVHWNLFTSVVGTLGETDNGCKAMSPCPLPGHPAARPGGARPGRSAGPERIRVGGGATLPASAASAASPTARGGERSVPCRSPQTETGTCQTSLRPIN